MTAQPTDYRAYFKKRAAVRPDLEILSAFASPTISLNPKPISLSQRAGLRALAEAPRLADELGFSGPMRTITAIALCFRGLARPITVRGEGLAKRGYEITPAGLALLTTLPELRRAKCP